MKIKTEIGIMVKDGKTELFMEYTNKRGKLKRYEGTQFVVETAQRMWVHKKMWGVWELAKHLDSLKK